MVLKNEHIRVGNAIQMWMDTLIHLCDENTMNLHVYEYHVFIVNMLNAVNNPNMETLVKQAIHDFHDYFYTNQHICDVNRIHQSLGELDNNYGSGNLQLLQLLEKIKTNQNLLSVFQNVTIYVFDLIQSYGKENLGLPTFENVEKDLYISKYYTRYP